MREGTFSAETDLNGIDTLVSLGVGTCTHRAADVYCSTKEKQHLQIVCVETFEKAMETVRNNVRAMMLVPELHAVQKELEKNPLFTNLSSQNFALPNPPLYIATPSHQTSDRTYLWALPTLLPLVKEAYQDDLPFEEIIPARSTQDAAIHCARVFGGGFCVTNEEGLRLFDLRSVQPLRHILMKWFLYRKSPKNRGNK
jgi:hypothetical protein